jgi:alpha-L-rhamnosidase
MEKGRMPGFDDADWVGARIYPVGNCKLVSQYNEPIRIMHDLVPIAITEPAPGTYVFDMGQNMVGWCRLKATGPRGTVVTLRHAEALQDDGNIYTENLRNAMQTDTFILSGEGIEVLEPHFTYHGFRYVEVTGLPNKPLLEDLTGRVFYSSAPATGAFECSDSMLNKLMENIVWTQRGNMHSTPTDCPQRDERLGWMGDAQLFSQTACYNMQMARFFTKWAADIRDAQTDEGVFSVFSPNPYKHLNQGLGAPGWSDAGVIIPWRVYLNYGDKELLHEHYQAAAAWVDYVWKHNQDLIWRHQRGSDFGDWLNADTLDLADWPDSGGQVPNEVYATCFFAHSADLVARMAAIVGDEVGAKRYSQLFNDVKAAFCREFVSADGRITGDTQAGYALALHFDLLPQDLRDTALKYLLEGIERYNGHPSTGIQATNRMMLELVRGGRADVAYDLLTKRTVPSWFYMIECGATTIWERWDGYVKGRGFQTPRMNSFNHYAFGAIGEWIFRNIAGINLDVDEPAFKHIIIKPVIGGGITYAKGKYDSMYGEIQSSWSKSEHEFRLEIAIPGNTTATVYLPFGDPNLVTESGARLENSEQIELLQVDGEQMVLRVGAGRYSFVVTQ